LLADADRREAQRFASLIQTLEKIASTAPSQLACAAFTNFFPADPAHHLTAYIIDGEGTIHTVSQIVTEERWSAQLDKLVQRPETPERDVQIERLQALIATPVDTQWVTVPFSELCLPVIEQGLRSWMDKYFPPFANIDMNWLGDADKVEFGKTLTKQSLRRRLLEDPTMMNSLLERLLPDTKEP
jgi:hypothetical protein